MIEANRVVCAGVITLDALALVDGYPAADSRVEAELVELSGGGPAANAAVVLARQGVEVTFVGRVGDDASGDQTVQLLQQEGVDVSGIERVSGMRTQASAIVVDRQAGTRAISTQLMAPWTSLSPEQQEIVMAADWIHTDHLGFLPVTNSCQTVPANSVLSIDAGNPVRGFDMSYVDLFIPTVSSLIAQYGRGENESNDNNAASCAASQAIAAGATAVVATDGSQGSYVWWSDKAASLGGASSAGRASCPAYSGVDIVSTLGAGDVFHGALIAALVRGSRWKEALAAANMTAALSCRALDGRGAVPTLKELNAALEAHTA